MAESAKELLYGTQKESAKQLLYGNAQPQQPMQLPEYINPSMEGVTAKKSEPANLNQLELPKPHPLHNALYNENILRQRWAQSMLNLKGLSDKIGERIDETDEFYGKAPNPYRDPNTPLTKAEREFEGQSPVMKLLSTGAKTAERYGLGAAQFLTSLPAKIGAPELFVEEPTDKPASQLVKQEGQGFLQMMTDLPAQALYIGARAIGLQPEQADDIPTLIDNIVKTTGYNPELQGRFQQAVNSMYESPESPIFAAQIGRSALKGALPKKTDITKEAKEFEGYDPLKYRYEDLQVVDPQALPNPKGQPRTQPAEIVRPKTVKLEPEKKANELTDPQKEGLREQIPDNAIQFRPGEEFVGGERGSVAPPSTKPQKPSNMQKSAGNLQNTQIIPPLAPQKTVKPPIKTPLSSLKVGKLKDPLIDEAKKYKTVDEFVSSFGNAVYHGSPNKFSEFKTNVVGVKGTKGGGIYFSPYKETAKNFGENISEVYLDIKNPKIAKSYIEIGRLKKEDIQQAISEGYDGYYFKPSPEDLKSGRYRPYNEEWVAFEPSQVKTKSQLTDIWNEANKPTPKSPAVEKPELLKDVKQEAPVLKDKPVSVNKGDIITPIGVAIAGATALTQDDDDLVKAGAGIFALTGLMRSPLKDKGGKKLSEVQKKQLIDRINKDMAKTEAKLDKTRQINQTAYENLKEYERRKAGVPKKDNEPIMSPADADATIRKYENDIAKENRKQFKEKPKKAEAQTEAGRLANQIINKDIIPLLDEAPKMRDIGKTDVGRKAIYRNTRRVFGKEKAEQILEPFDKAKERMVTFVKDHLDEVKTKVWKELGIKPGTSLSAAVQKYGEQNMKESYKNELQFIEDIIKSEKPTGKYKRELVKYRNEVHNALKELSGYDYHGLVKRYGKKKADNIVKADTYFRTTYDRLLGEINDVRTQIKLDTPDKFAVVKKGAAKNKSGDSRAYRVFDTKAEADNFVRDNENKELAVEVRQGKSEAIPKRKDYYRHFRELSGGLGDLVTLLDSPDQISAKLVNISEFTHPKTKWTSIAQRRKGIKTDFDAVKGFVDYINHAAFAIHMDPMVTFFKNFNEGLRESTDGVNNINNYIQFIDYFQQHIAGKTNPYDRFLQENLTGRRGLRLLNWLNGRIASNTVGLSVSTLLVQPANLAQGIAEAKQYTVPGGLMTLAAPFMKNAPQKFSPFLRERYLGLDLDSFNRFSWWRHLKNSKKVSGQLLNYFDAIGTNMIWNSLYLQAKAKKVTDPIRYADNKTRDLVGGRGIGEMGLVFKSVGGRIFLNFQYEVDNLWQVMRDWTTEKQFGTLLTFFVSAYVMNQMYEEIFGRPVLIDPVQTGLDVAEIVTDDQYGIGEKAVKTAGRIGGEILSESAGGQVIAQALPLNRHQRKELFGSENDPARYGDPAAMLRTLRDVTQTGWYAYKGEEEKALGKAGSAASKLVLPTGGGQIKKTMSGVNALEQGRVFDNKGKTQYFIDVNDPAEVAKALFFGVYATDAARTYYSKRGQR